MRWECCWKYPKFCLWMQGWLKYLGYVWIRLLRESVVRGVRHEKGYSALFSYRFKTIPICFGLVQIVLDMGRSKSQYVLKCHFWSSPKSYLSCLKQFGSVQNPFGPIEGQVISVALKAFLVVSLFEKKCWFYGLNILSMLHRK